MGIEVEYDTVIQGKMEKPELVIKDITKAQRGKDKTDLSGESRTYQLESLLQRKPRKCGAGNEMRKDVLLSGCSLLAMKHGIVFLNSNRK